MYTVITEYQNVTDLDSLVIMFLLLLTSVLL